MVFKDLLDAILNIYSTLEEFGESVFDFLTYNVAGVGSIASILFGIGIGIYLVAAIAKWINPFE